MSEPTRPPVPEPADPQPVPGPVDGAAPVESTAEPAKVPRDLAEKIGESSRLADGEWQRLHPATPLLKGGIAFVAILGIILVNLRDLWIEILLPGRGPSEEYDPFAYVFENGYVIPIILAIIGGLLVCIAAFYFSWRMHTFRITDEQVEVRSGILFRTNRRGRLDRIQGINVGRPFLARLFGAAKLEVNVAGQDANVQLAYLGSAAADELRREILLLASGTQAAASPPAVQKDAAGGIVERRMGELLAPELDPDAAPPESVVKMNIGRLIGSVLLSVFTIVVVLSFIGIIIVTSITGEFAFLFGLVPGVIGVGSYYWTKITKSLRYSIAGTPDGIRVGYGLLSTSNETLPPGRIHALQVYQSPLWRIPGWWEIKINRAASTSSQASGQANTIILPIGDLADVRRVLELVLPGLADEASVELVGRGITSKGTDDDGFVNSPRRAAILRWFSWRRTGFATTAEAVLLRRGAIFRELIVIPQARIQSVGLQQGPVRRALRVATVSVHTVAGPITTSLGGIDTEKAAEFFQQTADGAVSSASTDTSHRWRNAVSEASSGSGVSGTTGDVSASSTTGNPATEAATSDRAPAEGS